MKIKSLQLKNFKRFTNLTLQDIPGNAKLVLLIGSNGSGKSSVFDAFETSSAHLKGNDYGTSLELKKNSQEDLDISIRFSTELILERNNDRFIDKGFTPFNFYGRSSFRQIPRLKRYQLGEGGFDPRYDSDRPRMYIDRDERLENDLEHIFGKLLREYFVSKDNNEIHEQVIAPLNNAFERIFGTKNGAALLIKELIPPLERKIAEVNFKKGKFIFHYNSLSAGGKEVFNILINLIARKEYYQDTIYFFDEIDLHLNTKLQYNFLKEITENWIPENCQLWTASHSLGFIQYAKESEHAVIFDFDDYDFDYPRILSPEPKDNADIYNIAVSKELLPKIFKGYKIFFVENRDRLVYSELNIGNTLFVQENGKAGVYHKAKNGEFAGIVDRDFLTDDDILEIEKQYTSLKILRYYSVENYLFHPDNLVQYYQSVNKNFDKDGYIENLKAEKDKASGELIRKLALVRTSYPFFKEPEFQNTKNQKRFINSTENLDEVANLELCLKSNIFEDFYKVFPMKDYATQLPGRQNLSKIELAKTNWFRSQIEAVIK